MPSHVSIIIPAHNAALTLAETLQSVRAQTCPHWEAIVIENGSTDATLEVASQWAALDSRIRVTRSEPGVGRARNQGLRIAQHPWILFLDADDWILPTHLAQLIQHLEADPSLDAAHCGWLRMGPDGAVLVEGYGPPDTDLFPRFARTCAITIHSCIIRRSLIEQAGGFDPSLRTCEDWDLWQRVARLGCRFGAVREALACYRTRPGSASMNAAQLVSDSRRVIERGFSSDPRLAHPQLEHAHGATGGDLQETLLYTVAWAAGVSIGNRVDPRPLLDLIDVRPGVTMDASGVAGCIHCCAMLPFGLPTSAWADKFAEVEPLLAAFLQEFETRLQQRGLARSILIQLSRLALADATRPRPFTVGTIHALDLEITEPIPSVSAPPGAERLHCAVRAEGQKLGVLELPIFDGRVPSGVLADAIVAEFAWPILGRFFSHTVYPTLQSSRQSDGWTVTRGRQTLANRIAGNGTLSWDEAHDQIGWTVFLQEVWGVPDILPDAFYASLPDRTVLEAADPAATAEDWLVVEASDPLPETWEVAPGTTAVLTVGGVAVAQTRLAPAHPRLSSSAVRAALTAEASFELCRVSVREAVLGRPMDGTPLRTRLAAATAVRRATVAPTSDRYPVRLLPGSSSLLQQSAADGTTIVLPRWSGPCGSAASRRALLPHAALPEIAEAGRSRGDPVLTLAESAAAAGPVVYLPEVLWRPVSTLKDPDVTVRSGRRNLGRRYFESLFQQRPNPWFYRTAYEQKKYEQTLELLPRARFHRALELACAEGHFTAQLAPRVDDLLATDVSGTAVRRAQDRCRDHPSARFAELDFVRDPIEGKYDLIVCSEALYYAGGVEPLRRVARKIAGALAPGGFFVTAHAHVLADEPHRPGFDWDLPFGAKRISDVFGTIATLRLVRDLRTPLYRIQVYQRQNPLRRLLAPRPVERIHLPQPTPLPPHVVSRVSWRGGYPAARRQGQRPVTARLPILMYHQIAPTGPADHVRYRTTPADFDAQLAWLAAQGFRYVSLDEWRQAAQARTPLPGRCVSITFDDGYHDFLDYAWPLLQRHGYAATMFLPTDHIAGTNEWDRGLADPSSLLSWDEIRALRAEGVEFGSHSASHPSLTGVPPTEVAREALRSRVALEENLDAPVTSFAYPYGEVDRVVESVVGASGYIYGVTCEERWCEMSDRLLALPRLEVRGELDLSDFQALLPDPGDGTG